MSDTTTNTGGGANALSAILDNPEAMKKIAALAGEFSGNAAAAPAALPPASSDSVPDPASELLQKAVPLLSSIARSGQNAVDPNRLRLLTALKPFVSDTTAAQLDHAARLLSVAHMTRTAASQILTKEV